MESHSVTYHPSQVNAHRLTPARLVGTQLSYPVGIEGWVDPGGWVHTQMVYLSEDTQLHIQVVTGPGVEQLR